MATRKHSSKFKRAAIAEADGYLPLSPARRKIAAHAHYQLESIIEAIREIARKDCGNDAQGQLLALALRADALNGVAMAAVGDEGDDFADLVKTLDTSELDDLLEVAHG